MPGLLGKKIGMMSVFSADGKNVPCTVIEAGPCAVTQVKTIEKDGYEAVQLGFQDQKESRVNAPLAGHFKKAGVTPKRHLAEFKGYETELSLGDENGSAATTAWATSGMYAVSSAALKSKRNW